VTELTLVERVPAGGSMPLHIVTACHGDRRDGCLVGFATQASMKPARMLVCLSTANLTYRIAVLSHRLAVHLVPADRHEWTFGPAIRSEQLRSRST
jgi:flavin reductase (DIM6/NTAB) family NADH-FMN oxidoreductase RutF